MRKIAQFGKYIRSLAIPPWTSFTVSYTVWDAIFSQKMVLVAWMLEPPEGVEDREASVFAEAPLLSFPSPHFIRSSAAI
jgi:hypothetical protein